MKHIQIKILNPEDVQKAEEMMVFCARLTQRGHKISDMTDLEKLHMKEYKEDLVRAMVGLPHPTIQKFGVINIAVVGASRRFLAQITRHQNEVKFMSASLQYSDYSDACEFCIPYEVTEKGKDMEAAYLKHCEASAKDYGAFAKVVGNDAAGYLMPQGMRNILIISATPFQIKHMISQRICNRNTTETKYVMLKIWEALYELSPEMFDIKVTGAGCQKATGCQEGKMCCKRPFSKKAGPKDILKAEYPLLLKN